MRRLTCLLVALLGVAGCGQEPVVEGEPTKQVTVDPNAPLDRPLRRMHVDQLQASIERVTGGIRWTDGDDDLLEELAGTLGRPDYLEVTHEDLEPGLVFQKFLDDAAIAVCD